MNVIFPGDAPAFVITMLTNFYFFKLSIVVIPTKLLPCGLLYATLVFVANSLCIHLSFDLLTCKGMKTNPKNHYFPYSFRGEIARI